MIVATVAPPFVEVVLVRSMTCMKGTPFFGIYLFAI
jgi:hypothetical protein